MANTVSSTAIINILSTEDSTQNIPINRGATVNLDSIFGLFVQYGQLIQGTNNPLILALPSSPIYCFYLRNTNATNGASLQLTVTPNGGAAQSYNLGPGDVFLYWTQSKNAPVVGGVSQGLTAVVITAGSSGTSTFEYYMGA